MKIPAHPDRQPLRSAAAFTIMEIAICLAIIGFALIAIIGVLPIGMRTQTNNREETIINQDATEFLNAIHSGARGLDDLTNYVYLITNTSTLYNAQGNVVGSPLVYGYTFTSTIFNGASHPEWVMTNGARIVGLLSTPRYTGVNANDDVGLPIPSLINGGYSNFVVAYVHSISGLAVEKPPQDNGLLREGTFSYRMTCVNAPVPADTNLFNYPFWSSQPTWSSGNQVICNWHYWKWQPPVAATDATTADIPGYSPYWVKVPNYELEQLNNLHELRLRFQWPLRPNNGEPDPRGGVQNFRVSVAGQLFATNHFGVPVYFYQSQSFVSQP
jgi:type II secretory pathway pseudopilin PulG